SVVTDLCRWARRRGPAHGRFSARPRANDARPAGRREAGGDDRLQPAGVNPGLATPPRRDCLPRRVPSRPLLAGSVPRLLLLSTLLLLVAVPIGDRKSTRLNSSHVK